MDNNNIPTINCYTLRYHSEARPRDEDRKRDDGPREGDRWTEREVMMMASNLGVSVPAGPGARVYPRSAESTPKAREEEDVDQGDPPKPLGEEDRLRGPPSFFCRGGRAKRGRRVVECELARALLGFALRKERANEQPDAECPL